ncbi:MAG: rhomboid family intramembrane serine protease [Myxococcota bacterium]
MTSSDDAKIGPALPITHRKREAEDWALVLIAEGIPSQLFRTGGGFSLQVAPETQTTACEILTDWQIERIERARRFSLPIPRGATAVETAAAYLFALSLLPFHLGLEAAGRSSLFLEMGRSQAALVLDGQWWRLITALTLHADLPHVVGNSLFGGFFLAAVAGRLGLGFAVAAFLVTGTLGNFANALYYESAHSSVGASTGVFGLVGVLAGLAAWQRHHSALPGRGAWVAFAAGLGLVAMLGSGGARVDFSAHLFGLAAGGLTGLLLAVPFAKPARPGRAKQGLATIIALAIVLTAWLRALG